MVGDHLKLALWALQESGGGGHRLASCRLAEAGPQAMRSWLLVTTFCAVCVWAALIADCLPPAEESVTAWRSGVYVDRPMAFLVGQARFSDRWHVRRSLCGFALGDTSDQPWSISLGKSLAIPSPVT